LPFSHYCQGLATQEQVYWSLLQ